MTSYSRVIHIWMIGIQERPPESLGSLCVANLVPNITVIGKWHLARILILILLLILILIIGEIIAAI